MKTRDQLVVEVASVAHEDWRKQYRASNGDKPRVKKTKDQSFLDRGVTEVDIAALSYPELPSDWQNENRLGAECVVDCVLQAVSDGQHLDNGFVESASSVAHDKWLERNGSWAPEHQKLPYSQLNEEEKEKDRFFVRAAIAAYQEDEMQGLEWGRLHEAYHKKSYNSKKVWEEVQKLYSDPYVKNRKGIFEFILGGSTDTKLLDVRFFDEATKNAVYKKQRAVAEKKGKSNCSYCAIGHDANKSKIWKFDEMDADHVAAWSKGGTTSIKNCEMLCKTHNRAKGNR